MTEQKTPPQTALPHLARKITATLFAGQSIFSAGMIAMFTVLTIVGSELSGNDAWAGVPNATIQLAAAPAAFIWGLLWDRIGRRNGLALGISIGAFGLLLSMLSVEVRSFPLFLLGLVGVGFARAANRLSRFVAAEVNHPAQRGRAISYVVLGGTVGAVVGPLLVAPSSRWASLLTWNKLSGPFLIAAALFGLAAFAAQLGLRPEPQEISKRLGIETQEAEGENGTYRPISELLRHPPVVVAMLAMVLGQAVMIMVMGITSLHMKDLNHSLGSISLVISAHTLGMFAFSVLSGRLADRWGRAPVIITGALLILLSNALAPIFSQVFPLAFALFLLGLGWNFCFVGGSALLADQLTPAERSRTQGFNDLLIGLVSAFGSISSSLIYWALDYSALNLAGGLAILLVLGLTLRWNRRRARLPLPS